MSRSKPQGEEEKEEERPDTYGVGLPEITVAEQLEMTRHEPNPTRRDARRHFS